MKNFFKIFFLTFVVLSSCKKSDASVDKVVEQAENQVQLPDIEKIPANVKAKTDSWEAFKNYETAINRLKGSGDVITEAEALISLEEELSKSQFPREFNIPAVKSRILVMKTFINQLEASEKDKLSSAELQDAKIKIIESYNSFLKQLSEALEKNITEEFLKDE